MTAGSAGVTIGLAIQGSLSNLAGGILIIFLKPFKVGDYIKEDTNGNEGTVTEISLFYTKLTTYDEKIIKKVESESLSLGFIKKGEKYVYNFI